MLLLYSRSTLSNKVPPSSYIYRVQFLCDALSLPFHMQLSIVQAYTFTSVDIHQHMLRNPFVSQQHSTHDNWNFFFLSLSLTLPNFQTSHFYFIWVSFSVELPACFMHSSNRLSHPVVFPSSRCRLTLSFNLNICVYVSCYSTIMDILQCRRISHRQAAASSQANDELQFARFSSSNLNGERESERFNRQFVAAKSWENKLNGTFTYE